VVIVLAIGPKVRMFKPDQRLPSEGEIKPAVPRRKVLRHVKDAYSMREIYLKAKFTDISRQVFHSSLLVVSAGYCQRTVVGELGLIRTQMGKHNR
jgi:hypothetical protein